jgi:hypothetical protein
MKSIRLTSALLLMLASAALGGGLKIKNKFVVWHDDVADGGLQTTQLDDKINGRLLNLSVNCLQVTSGDGTVLRLSGFKPENDPQIVRLKTDDDLLLKALMRSFAAFGNPENHYPF